MDGKIACKMPKFKAGTCTVNVHTPSLA